jgi:RHS repeat-associated protein
MVQVNLPNGSSVVYSYDHSGKRIAKTAGGVTIDYYFDGDDLITEAQGANILAYYTQGQGLLSQRRNNASYFYHYDGLGSTKALTDANQNIQNTTKYDAWGNILQSSGTITNPYLYVGELGYYGDGDAGMYLLTQRWYNPVVGRFVVRDLINFGKLNASEGYRYVANNPPSSVDPYGLVPIPIPRFYYNLLKLGGAVACLGCFIGAAGISAGTCAVECLPPSPWVWVTDCLAQNFGEFKNCIKDAIWDIILPPRNARKITGRVRDCLNQYAQSVAKCLGSKLKWSLDCLSGCLKENFCKDFWHDIASTCGEVCLAASLPFWIVEPK